MTLYTFFITPFADYGFMRRALVACIAVACSGAPLGVFLVLRRMALVGDAISHAILPGVALTFLWCGLSLAAMTLGGLAAGLVIALMAGWISRATPLKEDASFTGMYLLSLSAGVLIISLRGSTIDLMHVLFGNVLAMDGASLRLICAMAAFSIILLAAIYRPLVMECFDADFLRVARGNGVWVHQLFLALVVLNLVAAFQALGTLMALGLMALPAIAARFWTRNIDGMMLLSMMLSIIASFVGLLLSYHANLPSGPAIVLVAGVFYVLSILFGRYGGVMTLFLPKKHFAS